MRVRVQLILRAALPVILLAGAVQAQPAWAPLPDRVLGQIDLVRTYPNFVDNRGLRGPQAIAVDTSVVPNRVYVLDARNNRVLAWRDAATLRNGAPADLVLGQPDAYTTGCNSIDLDARSLCTDFLGPFRAALAVDAAGNLYVTDTDNFRVLEYDSPFTTDTVADRVFGRPDFTSNTCPELPDGTLLADNPCFPVGLAVDRAGTLYISDSSLGIFVYDNPLATDTVPDAKLGRRDCERIGPDTLCLPQAVAVDASGNLYVAEPLRNRVTVFLSPRTTDAVADFVLGPPDFISKGDCGADAGDPPPPLAAGFCAPHAIAVDGAGNVFVADPGFHRVLEYDAPIATDSVPDRVLASAEPPCKSPFNPGAAELFCLPVAVATGGRGELYVADIYNRVLRFNAPLASGARPDLVLGQAGFTHGAENRVDGRGFWAPQKIVVDRASSPNRLFLLDANNSRVLGWRDAAAFAAGAPANLVFGQPDLASWGCNSGGLSARSFCFYPGSGGLAVDGAGNLYVADSGNHRVLEYDSPFTTDTTPDAVFGQGGSFDSAECNRGGIGAGTLCLPGGLAVDARGNLYVADAGNHRVLQYNQPLRKDTIADRVFGKQGNFRSGATPSCRGGREFLCFPTDLAVGGAGDLYVADTGNSRVLRYDAPLTTDTWPDQVFGQNGSFTSRACRVGGDRLCRPAGLALDSAGALYVADPEARGVVRFPARKETRPPIRRIVQGPIAPTGVAFDGDGRLYVVDPNGNRVLMYLNP